MGAPSLYFLKTELEFSLLSIYAYKWKNIPFESAKCWPRDWFTKQKSGLPVSYLPFQFSLMLGAVNAVCVCARQGTLTEGKGVSGKKKRNTTWRKKCQ